METRPIDAVHVLSDINWHHKPTPVSEFESGFNQGLNQAMWIITHAPTLTPPNEWVSVEDELPARDGVYLVFTMRGSVTTAHFYAEKTFSDGHRRSANWQGNRKVTHWMPLPEPPEEI